MDDSIAVNKPTASGDRVAHAISASAVRFYTPLAFALSLLILVLRYPTSLFAAEPLWEDGPIFYLKGFDGLSSLAQSYRATCTSGRGWWPSWPRPSHRRSPRC